MALYLIDDLPPVDRWLAASTLSVAVHGVSRGVLRVFQLNNSSQHRKQNTMLVALNYPAKQQSDNGWDWSCQPSQLKCPCGELNFRYVLC